MPERITQGHTEGIKQSITTLNETWDEASVVVPVAFRRTTPERMPLHWILMEKLSGKLETTMAKEHAMALSTQEAEYIEQARKDGNYFQNAIEEFDSPKKFTFRKFQTALFGIASLPSIIMPPGPLITLFNNASNTIRAAFKERNPVKAAVYAVFTVVDTLPFLTAAYLITHFGVLFGGISGFLVLGVGGGALGLVTNTFFPELYSIIAERVPKNAGLLRVKRGVEEASQTRQTYFRSVEQILEGNAQKAKLEPLVYAGRVLDKVDTYLTGKQPDGSYKKTMLRKIQDWHWVFEEPTGAGRILKRFLAGGVKHVTSSFIRNEAVKIQTAEHVRDILTLYMRNYPQKVVIQ